MRTKNTFSRYSARLRLFAIAATVLLAISQQALAAVTRAEMTSALFGELGYAAISGIKLPPDVRQSHKFAKQIGSAAAYGLIPSGEYFSPDEALNRHDAVKLSLMMMGWGLEASLYESLTSLPDLGGSGDTVFFLASEMKPQAPSNLLVDGLTPLSDSGKKALLDWVKRCRKFVQWNRVFSYGGTDLTIYRQGVARPGEPNKPGNGNLVGATECEPLYVAAIAVHTDAVDTRIAFAEPIGSGRITPSEFFSAYDPIALINGGFFSGPRPLGTMLLDGVHAGKPIVGRSAIGWNNSDGTFSFGRGNAKIGAKTKRGYVEFTKFNVPPPPDEAALYTPDVARSSIGIGLDSLQIVLVNDVVAEVREAREGKFLMPEGGTMMIARGKARAMFDPVQPGEKIKVLTDWENGSFGASTNLIQAGPMLIRENKFTTDTETFKDDVLEKRHPRTIVGTDGKRMIWAVVDGRSAIHSRGATISETRWIAKSLGLTTAINMDGGGSSQIMWRGVMMNLPADGKERPLPYAVMMLPKGMKLVRANSYLNGPDQGEFGEYGYNASEEGVAEYMDTYDPMSTKN